jgi:K+-sensing histidine kinase KdpD
MSIQPAIKILPENGTWFAPAARATAEQVQEMADYCLHNPIAQAILDSVDGYVLILNTERQVLAANPETLMALNVHDMECLLGLRPGEIFGCAFSEDAPGGCGTSKNCSTCGAVLSILASQELKEPSTQECLMSVLRDGKAESHEFMVRSTPLKFDDYQLTIFVAHDISATKRRDALENVFLHDLNNIITGLGGWSTMLSRRPDDAPAIARKIADLSSRLNQEVQNQRLLLQAERGELKVAFEAVDISRVMDELAALFAGYALDIIHRLDILHPDRVVVIETSPLLLSRVLANMVKNAFEATRPNQKVQVWFECCEDGPKFVVHNPGVIPEEVALQIFKRSFSTKGSQGRGLGTYSMKLFGEQYLGGQVAFSSREGEGTCFHIKLPTSSLVKTMTT